MDDDVQIRRSPCPIFFDSLDVSFMRPFKYPVARNMIPLLLNILPNAPDDIPVVDSCSLQQRRKIVNAEVAIRTAVTFSTSWRVFA